MERLTVYLTKPIFSFVYKSSTWIGDKYLNHETKQQLEEENKELKDQIIALINEKSKYLVEAEENEFLKSQLKFIQEHDYDFEVARVIGRNLDSAENAIIIDKGSDSGLSDGQPVLAEQGIIIGKLIRVSSSSSLVLLLNDDLSKLAAKVQNQGKTIGVVEGEYGLGMRMRLVPQAEKIKEGDVVVTSGLEPKVPKGLVIGLVKSVKSEPEELFQEASIETMVDFNKVILVNIIKEIK